jgi:type IV pilus assembly protein PilA
LPERRRTRGISLVEVLIALSVVALLAAFAVPSYGTYTRRIWVSEGLLIAQAAKPAAVEEAVANARQSSAYQMQARFLPVTVVASRPSRMIDSVVRIDRSSGPILIITFSEAFDPRGLHKLSLPIVGSRGDGKFTWRCIAGDDAMPSIMLGRDNGVAVGEPLPLDLAPSDCRG